MNDEKFKVGDRVKIINCFSIEPYELNKIGVVIEVRIDSWGGRATYVVDMGRPRREREPENTCWYLHESKIGLVSQPNTQLLFNFMY